MAHVQLLEKIKQIPPAYQQEVEDFIDFILEKKVKVVKSEGNRVLGLLKGKMKMADDFDAPLEDYFS